MLTTPHAVRGSIYLRVRARPIVCAVFALACQTAAAGLLPQTYHVGVTGIGSACTFSTIAAAVAGASAGDRIVLDGGQSYAGQHVVIDKSLTISAGPCQPIIGGGVPDTVTSNPQVTISGDANASSAVLTMTGAINVTLIDLKITGNTSSGDGGGIGYQGTGTLTLNNVSVVGNKASRGAGILFDGQGNDAAQLVLGADAQVTGNKAQVSGGGIRMQGNATLMATASGILIAENQAPNGYGGGIELYGAIATLGSGGVGGLPMIYGNSAMYGGGVAIEGDSGPGNDATLNIDAFDAQYPVRIEGNSATLFGGGIYITPANGIGSNAANARLYADRYRIDLNIAQEGSAIYADCVELTLEPCGLGTELQLYNIACAPGVECNAIDGNVNEDGLANPTDGATIRIKYGSLFADGVHMRMNHGGHVLSSTNGGEFEFYTSLLAENQVTQELIKADYIFLYQCTLANDLIQAAYTINHTSDLQLTLDNIVFGEQGTAALEGSTTNAFFENIVAVDKTGLPNAVNIIEADPLFFDVAHSDYRLRVQTDGITSKESPAVDFAANDIINPELIDIDGRTRPKDLPFLVNRLGPIDLGAYEMQPITDRLFANAFGDPYQLVY